jgi:putative transposase
MPRPHYFQPAGVALHIIQRARAACFPGERDRLAYLYWLAGYAQRFECAVHAYVLMGNHVHLLLTPARADGAAGMMRALCARYEHYVDETYERTGALWEEGVDASPIHARQYLLACMRYIESNPVRAQLVTRPGAYRWSSYRANALGREDALVTPHALYYSLGRTREARQAAYRALFRRAPCMLRGRTVTRNGERHG